MASETLRQAISLKLKSVLAIGETVAVEFKRAGGRIGDDVYESVCAFLNRFGGDIYLGVLDNGKVEGIPENAAIDMLKNIINVANNPTLFQPTTYLNPEIIRYNGKTLIRIHVPQSSEVHSYKRVVYDRINDADVKVSATSQIAQMFIRKQGIFTEQRVFPYLKKKDLRMDLLGKVRLLAVNNAGGNHPWQNMNDNELLKSASLYTIDYATGKPGFTLAAALLLGRDEVIHSICPAYRTDALLRRENVERYDDREIVDTNLIESYERLFEFAKKHLPDKFFVEDAVRKSLRNIIIREMISNTLMHREYTSSFQSRFVIERGRIYVENANRASSEKIITPENLEPKPKNPTIASFFRNIGYADQLGSGVRKLFTYAKSYGGDNPTFSEGDVFRTTVLLDDALDGAVLTSHKAERVNEKVNVKVNEKVNVNSVEDIGETQRKILNILRKNPSITQNAMSKLIGISLVHINKNMKILKEKGYITRIGSDKRGTWVVKFH